MATTTVVRNGDDITLITTAPFPKVEIRQGMTPGTARILGQQLIAAAGPGVLKDEYFLTDHNTFAEILRQVREDIIEDGSRDESSDRTIADVEHRLVDLFKDDSQEFDEEQFRARAGAYGKKSS